MKQTIIFLLLGVLLLSSSCVGKKKYTSMRGKYDALKITYDKMATEISTCEKDKQSLKQLLTDTKDQLRRKDEELDVLRKKLAELDAQLEYLRKTNNSLLDRLEDLSVVSKSGAESIRQSLESLNDQSKYIKDLNKSIRNKDSLNLALVMSIKRSLQDINDSDVDVQVKKGVVYISISDKMLFQTGSAVINAQAENVLSKIARIINDHREFDVLVEGHTDNVPITTSCMIDNWDLSAKRATSVVRSLQNKYGVMPSRMTAGGRSEYNPKASNEDASGKALNRRTELILLPKLEQFFKLLEEANK